MSPFSCFRTRFRETLHCGFQVSAATVSVSVSVSATVSISVSIYSIIDHLALLKKKNARVIIGMSPFGYSNMRFHQVLLCSFQLLKLLSTLNRKIKHHASRRRSLKSLVYNDVLKVTLLPMRSQDARQWSPPQPF